MGQCPPERSGASCLEHQRMRGNPCAQSPKRRGRTFSRRPSHHHRTAQRAHTDRRADTGSHRGCRGAHGEHGFKRAPLSHSGPPKNEAGTCRLRFYFLPPPFEGGGAGALDRCGLFPRPPPEGWPVLLGALGGADFAMRVIPVGGGVVPQPGYCQRVLTAASNNSSRVLAGYRPSVWTFAKRVKCDPANNYCLHLTRSVVREPRAGLQRRCCRWYVGPTSTARKAGS
jgi:hypothetical protein